MSFPAQQLQRLGPQILRPVQHALFDLSEVELMPTAHSIVPESPPSSGVGPFDNSSVILCPAQRAQQASMFVHVLPAQELQRLRVNVFVAPKR